MLFFAQGLVYFVPDIYTDVLLCVQCTSFVLPTPTPTFLLCCLLF
jgi:hypothetical protein